MHNHGDNVTGMAQQYAALICHKPVIMMLRIFGISGK